MSQAYFFDTYAIIEILKGNPGYEKYKHSKAVVTMFNLVELHYKILRDFGRRLAEKLLRDYSEHMVEVDIDSIINSNEFKLLHKKKRMSAPDVIGYTMARKFGIKFLTGDREFKNMANVEYVK